MDQGKIEKLASEFSEKYLFEHKETAKEAYLAAAKEHSFMFSHMETALEACNHERKKYRDKMDFACGEVSDRELKIKRIEDHVECLKNKVIELNSYLDDRQEKVVELSDEISVCQKGSEVLINNLRAYLEGQNIEIPAWLRKPTEESAKEPVEKSASNSRNQN
jgi:chromosome segregation ATPase